jgi:hypothetical protein
MTDRELEQRLRARYAAEVPETESAPEQLREALAAIPRTIPVPLRPVSRRRGFTLLAVAAVLLVGGAMAAGSGLLRFTTVTPPVPSNALLTTAEPTPTDTGRETPVPTPNVRPGGLIAFVRNVEKPRSCSVFRKTPTCPTPRVWVTGTDGRGAHELRADGMEIQTLLGWSPDGTRLLYAEGSELFVADPNGGEPQPVDTGCVTPSPLTPLSCLGDSQVSLSDDGRGIVFVRDIAAENGGYGGGTFIATMDLESGRTAVLNSTSIGGGHPAWSPDGQRIVFYQWGTKDSGNGDAVNPTLYVVGADGRNLRQVTPATLAAQDPDWSPDGARIVFIAPNPDPNDPSWGYGDIYTVRPDGSEVRRLTTDRLSASPSWTTDGRILFSRTSGGAGGAAAGWWTMNADTDSAQLVSAAAIGVEPSVRGPTGLAADRRIRDRAPWDAGDRGHRRTARAHAVADPHPGPRARVQLGRDHRHGGGSPARRHGHAARRRTRPHHAGLRDGNGAVRPIDRHVQPDGLAVGAPRGQDRDAAQ